jgi:alkylation response protein AidB-like acyl-CoA dehydrogenase
MGMKASDTAELFFDDVRVPVTNLLGEENRGFAQVMHEIPRERLSIATIATAAAQKAFDITVAYVKERQLFGKALMEHVPWHDAQLRVDHQSHRDPVESQSRVQLGQSPQQTPSGSRRPSAGIGAR